MLVAGIQLQCEKGKDQENRIKAIDYISLAAANGARIICLQEFFSTGGFTKEKKKDNFDLAQEMSGEIIQKMCKVAKEKQVWLIVPFFEKDSTVIGRYYNSAVIIDRKGNIIGKYRKQFIPESVSSEKYYFTPGNMGTPIFDYEGIKFGVAICYDRHFFEIFRTMLLKGADLVFVPTATTQPRSRENIWRMELITIAVINTLYVVGVNSTGFLDGKDQFGQSMIVDPTGRVLSSLEEEEGYILGEVSTEVIKRARIDFPIHRDFRMESLEELLKLFKTQGPKGETIRNDGV